MLTEKFFHSEFDEHADVLSRTRESCQEAFEQLLKVSIKSIKDGGKIMFFGNGGSAGDSQHLATELSVRYKTDRSPIAAIALTTDTSVLTAASNDIGFDGPLHECTIYNNPEAGEKLKSMLALGSSVPWQDAFEELTGVRELSGESIINYYSPLKEWLDEKNEGRQCGW